MRPYSVLTTNSLFRDCGLTYRAEIGIITGMKLSDTERRILNFIQGRDNEGKPLGNRTDVVLARGSIIVALLESIKVASPEMYDRIISALDEENGIQ